MDKFWNKVNKTPTCWLWTGATIKGYGAFGRPTALAHRVAYEMAYGPIPTGKHIRHICDVKNCVNPEHLLLGTHTENMNDAIARKRLRYGEQHPNSRLTSDEVQEIKRALKTYKHGLFTKLAMKYKVSLTTIQNIHTGRTWTEIKE